MTIPYQVDDITSVPEAFREHYTERNGQFRLNVDGIDTLAAQWDARTQTLIAERDAALASESAALLDATLTAALTRAGATRNGHELLTGHFRPRVKLDCENGRRVVQFFQDDRQTPMTGAGKNGAATWTDLMNEARSAFPSMFKE